MKILIIVGSTRENRKALKISKWIESKIKNIENIQVEIGDLKDFDLPHYNEPSSPRSSKGNYEFEETTRWSKVVEEAEAFIFVTPEYNGFFTGALKDAIDYLYYEWYQKPYAVVGYGSRGAKRAVKQLHNLLTAFDMKRINEEVGINQVWNAFKEGQLDEDLVDGDILKAISQIEELL